MPYPFVPVCLPACTHTHMCVYLYTFKCARQIWNCPARHSARYQQERYRLGRRRCGRPASCNGSFIKSTLDPILLLSVRVLLTINCVLEHAYNFFYLRHDRRFTAHNGPCGLYKFECLHQFKHIHMRTSGRVFLMPACLCGIRCIPSIILL